MHCDMKTSLRDALLRFEIICTSFFSIKIAHKIDLLNFTPPIRHYFEVIPAYTSLVYYNTDNNDVTMNNNNNNSFILTFKSANRGKDGISLGGGSYTIGQIGSDLIPDNTQRVTFMNELVTTMNRVQIQHKTVDNEHQLALMETRHRNQVTLMELSHRFAMELKRFDAETNAVLVLLLLLLLLLRVRRQVVHHRLLLNRIELMLMLMR